ncbi:hypothetical protein [Leadbetterella byssophila]|uniref:Lipopolysaccharide biosynthesis protein n=1 Tax=Leadbetterella byssophila (strain DSM 17132 / JCM 16389 / KACC 11308 / NBRC 106382 / 4M15) TaxID=649349 RepID=E4RS34_LEAB4|nr:hypothetical protein [Leadbetterella byssophila]ADQ15850.1 hypothetical protein Lbys_0054 [Leadbetterella byssophila DSM 17132]
MERDQISTKEFLQSVFSYFKFLATNWRILLIMLVAGNLIDMIKNNYFSSTKMYGGGIEFNIDLEGSTQSALGGLAGAFMGGAMPTTGGLTSIANFPQVIMSRTVFENALMTEVELYGRKDLLVNHFIDSSDIKTKEWGGNLFKSPSPNVNFKFEKKPFDKFEPRENEIMSDIITKLAGSTQLEKDEGSIYKLEAVLSNELLTKAWLETLLKATESFYTEIKTVKTRKMIAIQQRRVDSLSVLLRGNDSRLAKVTFEQPDVVNPVAGSAQTRLTRDNTYLSNLYFTNLTSLDNLNNLLVEQSQIFNVLNPVKLPLVATSRVGISVRLTGLILLFVTIVFISLRKTYLDVMSDH